MESDLVLDGGVASPEQQPKTKRRLSRLQHMTVNKAASSPSKDQELRRKVSPAAKAGFDVLHVAFTDAALQDQVQPVTGQPEQLRTEATVNLGASYSEGHAAPSAAATTETAQAGSYKQDIFFEAEHPSTSVLAHGQPAAAAATQAAGTSNAAAQQAVRLQDVDLDDDDDDEWEDQPAPIMPEDSAAQDASIGAEAAAETPAAEVVSYDPTSRRRKHYDDEEEWEQLINSEKQGSHSKPSVTDKHADDEQVQDSACGSDSAQESGDDDDILADDPDAVNAKTQRLLRESAAKDCLGKGFSPQVAPLNSILGKLAARQAALEAKARAQQAPQAEACVAQPPSALTFEQLKAHLEQRSLGQPRQQPEATAAGNGSSISNAAAAADEADLASNGIDVDTDDFDDLVVEPPQQQQQPPASASGGNNKLLPETQDMLLGLQHSGAVIVSDTKIAAGTAAPELDLQLEDADDQCHDGEAGVEDAHAEDGDIQEAAASSEDEDEEVNSSDEEELEYSGSEEEDEEEEQQSSEPLAEPLHWEEEEQDELGITNSQQQGEADAAGTKAAFAAAGGGKRKVAVRRAAGGFIEAEADLSDEEGNAVGDSEDEDDDEDDAELAELIAEVKEGRMDEARRAALHAQWMHGQEDRDIKNLLDAIKRGFRRKRKQTAGLDDDDDDGTDAAARRRRAQLLGTLDADADEDEELVVGSDRLQRLDFQVNEDEDEVAAAEAAAAAELASREKQRQIQKLQLKESQSQDVDVNQLLQMDVDEDSQHTAALLKSASIAVHSGSQGSSQGVGVVAAGSDSRVGLRAPAAAGAAKQAAAAGGKQGTTGGSGAGFAFQMFGKDLTNSAKPMKATGSFIGRQSSTTATVRAASTYGASRSFVFGSDPSNYSNPGGAGQDDSKHAASKHGSAGAGDGPSSFAGLSKLIPEAAAAATGSSRLGAPNSGSSKQLGNGSVKDASLLNMLREKKAGSIGVQGQSILKQHVDAVGAKFKAVGGNSRRTAGDDATSRGAWDF